MAIGLRDRVELATSTRGCYTSLISRLKCLLTFVIGITSTDKREEEEFED